MRMFFILSLALLAILEVQYIFFLIDNYNKISIYKIDYLISLSKLLISLAIFSYTMLKLTSGENNNKFIACIISFVFSYTYYYSVDALIQKKIRFSTPTDITEKSLNYLNQHENDDIIAKAKILFGFHNDSKPSIQSLSRSLDSAFQSQEYNFEHRIKNEIYQHYLIYKNDKNSNKYSFYYTNNDAQISNDFYANNIYWGVDIINEIDKRTSNLPRLTPNLFYEIYLKSLSSYYLKEHQIIKNAYNTKIISSDPMTKITDISYAKKITNQLSDLGGYDLINIAIRNLSVQITVIFTLIMLLVNIVKINRLLDNRIQSTLYTLAIISTGLVTIATNAQTRTVLESVYSMVRTNIPELNMVYIPGQPRNNYLYVSKHFNLKNKKLISPKKSVLLNEREKARSHNQENRTTFQRLNNLNRLINQ